MLGNPALIFPSEIKRIISSDHKISFNGPGLSLQPRHEWWWHTFTGSFFPLFFTHFCLIFQFVHFMNHANFEFRCQIHLVHSTVVWKQQRPRYCRSITHLLKCRKKPYPLIHLNLNGINQAGQSTRMQSVSHAAIVGREQEVLMRLFLTFP